MSELHEARSRDGAFAGVEWVDDAYAALDVRNMGFIAYTSVGRP